MRDRAVFAGRRRGLLCVGVDVGVFSRRAAVAFRSGIRIGFFHAKARRREGAVDVRDLRQSSLGDGAVCCALGWALGFFYAGPQLLFEVEFA